MRYDCKTGSWFTEPTDNCDSCPLYNNRETPCPLMEALVAGIFFTDGDFGVRNCGLFKKLQAGLDLPDKPERTLRVIK